MADERDPQISQRYRELGTEEPPPALDRAILAAARRATSRHRWYSSLAVAAVLIFAVAIVVQIERQPPDQVPMSTPSAPVVEQATPETDSFLASFRNSRYFEVHLARHRAEVEHDLVSGRLKGIVQLLK